MRALLLFAIGLIFGTGFGLLAGGHLGLTGHDHASHGGAIAGHDATTPWPGEVPAPTPAIMIHPDGETTRNLHIMADGFPWLPDQVNGEVGAPGGHAHVYVNGEKVARAYGPWLQLAHYPKGPVTIRVTFNANDHSQWTVDGAPLEAQETFE